MSFICRIPHFLSIPLLVYAGLATAADDLVLQATQIKALSIETALASEAGLARKGGAFFW